jgi:hypothetical protein
MKQFIRLIPLLLISLTQSVYAETTITVTQSISATQALTLQYPQPIRLVQVVQDSLTNINKLVAEDDTQPKAIYWLSAGLYDLATVTAAESQQRQILHLLSRQVSGQVQPQNTRAINTLSNWITANTFAKREAITLDFDAIRLKQELNPLISGRYLLTLPTKPEYVMVLGAVEKNGRQPFRTRQAATKYLDWALPIADSEKSFAWLIQPDGHVEHYPIAYWNNHHIDVAPGAIIYLEFQGAQENEQALNQQIIELLKHWIR